MKVDFLKCKKLFNAHYKAKCKQGTVGATSVTKQ